MSVKSILVDKLLIWALESKISPIGWLNGYKTLIGNVLTVVSGCLVLIEQTFCPGWQYCPQVAAANAFVLLLLSLLVKMVGEWHKQKKIVGELRP